MSKNLKYPLLQINTKHICENAEIIIAKCKENGINIAGVIKGFNGLSPIVDEFIGAGCTQIASSRCEQLIALRKNGIKTTNMLLRLPMKSEIDLLVKYIDISLNSEAETIDLIEAACIKSNTTHGVVLMLDLGDLREGFFDSKELIKLALYIENSLKAVKLIGVGTNLGCFGSIKPTSLNLGVLAHVANEINSKIGRNLEIVSGGETTSLPLMFEGKMPKAINHLRIGEAILLNRDLPDLWNINLPGMHMDTFILKAQIIEIKNKPSNPIGEQYLDGFGNKPVFHDKGIRKRALLAIGKQDFTQDDKLIPLESGVEIVGSSSDHLIVDIEDSKLDHKIGDVLEFNMYYGPMLYLSSSQYVEKIFL